MRGGGVEWVVRSRVLSSIGLCDREHSLIASPATSNLHGPSSRIIRPFLLHLQSGSDLVPPPLWFDRA